MNAYLTVGRNLADAEDILRQHDIKFTVTHTRPGRDFFKTDETDWRVVRETASPDGSLSLVVAAKQQSTCN